MHACMQVRRAHVKASGELYAIKEMAKAEILASGQVEHILQESEVLDELDHPCIANKVAAFQTISHLYLVSASAPAPAPPSPRPLPLPRSKPCAGRCRALTPVRLSPSPSSRASPFALLRKVLEFAPGGDLYDKLQTARQFPLDDARMCAAPPCTLRNEPRRDLAPLPLPTPPFIFVGQRLASSVRLTTARPPPYPRLSPTPRALRLRPPQLHRAGPPRARAHARQILRPSRPQA